MPNENVRVRERQKFPFLMIPKAYFTRFRFSWRADKAYLALKYFAGGAGDECDTVSIAAMAKIANTSADTIKRGIAELVKAGAVSKIRQTKENRDLPNLYELLDISADDPI